METEKKKWIKLRPGAKSPGEELEAYVPSLPLKSTAKLTRAIMRLMTLGCPAKFHYDFDRREMKGKQVLILAQHASREDPYYVNVGYPFVDPNAIMSRHNVLIPVMYKLMLADGVILKELYEPDFSAMRHLMRLHKKGASFLLFPEGIESTDGTTQPLHPATARLIKKLAMDTVLCTSHGSFLISPKFDTNKRKGRVEFNFEMLFRKEEIKEMPEEDIYSRLLEKFRYNDFEWNKEKQYKYKGKVPLAHNIDNLLFICPHCRKQFTMHVDEDRLVCECGRSVTIDECYNLIPDEKSDFPFERIDQWYRWQQDVIEEEVSKDDFFVREDVTYKVLNMDDLKKGRFLTAGEGIIELDREKLRYIGTKNGEKVDYTFDISRMPSASVNSEHANQIYYDGEYYQFAIKGDKRHSIKIMMAIEALHDKGDVERSKARKDLRAK